MIVGVPTETKVNERRVAITPAGVREVVSSGAMDIVQAGAQFDAAAHAGKEVLVCRRPGVDRARVTVLGAGVVGWNAIDVAVGMGARLVVLDVNLAKLESIEAFWGGRVETLYSSRQT